MPPAPSWADLALRHAARAFAASTYRVRVRGAEHMPARGGVLVVCNHVSFVDWLLVAAYAGRPVRFVIDHLFYRGPLLKAVLDQVRAIPISDPREDRGRVSQAYDRIVAELEAGEAVCIFPEGKITRDGRLNPFKPGMQKVLKRAPVPVVPMALVGLWGSVFSRRGGPAFRKLPRGFRLPVEVRIGEPIAPERATIAVVERRVRELLGNEPDGS